MPRTSRSQPNGGVASVAREDAPRRVGDGTVPKPHRTVSRVAKILEMASADQEGVTLGTLVRTLRAPKSSVHDLVRGLVAVSYLQEHGIDGTQTVRYRIGPGLSALLPGGAPTLSVVARPSLKRLHEQFNETAILMTLVGDSVVPVEAIESTHDIRYSPQMRRRRPVHATASGKCFLAHITSRRREFWLKELVSDPKERKELEAELEQVRAEGVAYSIGQTDDIALAAAPVIVGDRPIGCLVVGGPAFRMVERMDEAGDAVHREAALVTNSLN